MTDTKPTQISREASTLKLFINNIAWFVSLQAAKKGGKVDSKQVCLAVHCRSQHHWLCSCSRRVNIRSSPCQKWVILHWNIILNKGVRDSNVQNEGLIERSLYRKCILFCPFYYAILFFMSIKGVVLVL